MQANSRWLHSIRKTWWILFVTTKNVGLKKYAIDFASKQLWIIKVCKYPIDTKAYLELWM